MIRAAIASALFAAGCASMTAPEANVTVSTMTLDSEGWEIVGTLTRDENATAPQPAVIMLHRAAGERSEYDALAAELGTRGIVARE